MPQFPPFFSIFAAQQFKFPPGRLPQLLPEHVPHSAAQHATPSLPKSPAGWRGVLSSQAAFLHSAAADGAGEGGLGDDAAGCILNARKWAWKVEPLAIWLV